jgi:hypothetical protein
METVVSDDKLVATMKVEKEIYDCSGQLGDLYLFTERVEKADGDTFTTVQRRFNGVICFKNETAAKVTSCKLFTPAPAS